MSVCQQDGLMKHAVSIGVAVCLVTGLYSLKNAYFGRIKQKTSNNDMIIRPNMV
jgi:hypothetical protein